MLRPRNRISLERIADPTKETEKAHLLLESGVRFHTVSTPRSTPDHPSNFTLKVRKHIRGRRLEDIRQLGVDRIVVFTFGSGEQASHLILELYAQVPPPRSPSLQPRCPSTPPLSALILCLLCPSQGNLILADSKYEILTLLRSHRDDDAGLAIMSRHAYPISACRLRSRMTRGALEEAISAALQAKGAAEGEGEGEGEGGPVDGKGKKGKGKKGAEQAANLKAVVLHVLPWGPAFADHCVLVTASRSVGRVFPLFTSMRSLTAASRLLPRRRTHAFSCRAVCWPSTGAEPGQGAVGRGRDVCLGGTGEDKGTDLLQAARLSSGIATWVATSDP